MIAASSNCSVLVVDDEPSFLALLVQQLGHEFEVHTACSAAQARRVLAERSVDIVLAELQLPDATGLQLLEWVHRHAPHAARLLLTGTTRVEDAADAINCCRVHKLVFKPWRAEDLITTLRSVARELYLERDNDRLVQELRRSHLELERRVQHLTHELQQEMQQLHTKNQILEKMALTDALTGLPNRRAIELIARKELLRRTRTPAPLAFGLVDADWFREINSRYLHSGGDFVLTWLGQTLQDSIRATDALGRVGGEEFMVVAPLTDMDGAEILAERLRSAVESTGPHYHAEQIRVTVSVGFAVAPAGIAVGYEPLREVAAAALHQAKATGRNRCVIQAAA